MKHLHRAALDELGQPSRRIEEVERVAARRGVEDKQIESPLGVQLEQLLHRHVFLRPGEGVGELLVDTVGKHPVARLLVGRVPADKLVEGRLGVEHHRPQLALHLDSLRLEQGGVDALRLVAQLLQPKRVGEPLRGVDREHADLQPAGSHPGRDRSRRRRLADPARPRADADLLVLEDVGDRGHWARPVSRRARGRPRRPARAGR